MNPNYGGNNNQQQNRPPYQQYPYAQQYPQQQQQPQPQPSNPMINPMLPFTQQQYYQPYYQPLPGQPPMGQPGQPQMPHMPQMPYGMYPQQPMYYQQPMPMFQPFQQQQQTQQQPPQSQKRPDQETPGRTLFLRNMPYETTEADVRDLFQPYGDIKEVVLMSDRKGMGFVTYYDLRAAKKAQSELQGTKIRNRQIDVHYSIPKESDANSRQCDRDKNQGTILLQLKNGTQPLDDEQLRQLLKKYQSLKVLRPFKQFANQRFVEFWDSRDCQSAVDELKGMSMAGGTLELAFAWDNPLIKRTTQPNTGGKAQASRSQSRHDRHDSKPYGRSQQIQAQVRPPAAPFKLPEKHDPTKQADDLLKELLEKPLPKPENYTQGNNQLNLAQVFGPSITPMVPPANPPVVPMGLVNALSKSTSQSSVSQQQPQSQQPQSNKPPQEQDSLAAMNRMLKMLEQKKDKDAVVDPRKPKELSNVNSLLDQIIKSQKK